MDLELVEDFQKLRNENYLHPYINKYSGFTDYKEEIGITTSTNVYIRFAHLRYIYVNETDKKDVVKDTVIGTTGMTGIGSNNSTKGPHLHFEIMEDGYGLGITHRYNPAFYINSRYGVKEDPDTDKLIEETGRLITEQDKKTQEDESKKH